jgi:hypothetical protein
LEIARQGHDCIRGRDSLPGCELRLFQPNKVGNLDCTFCLDCVQACPHDNVGMIAVSPAASLWRDGPRSGIGRLSHRVDYAAMALVLVFGALANAAGMTEPVVNLETAVTDALGFSTTIVAATIFYFLCLVVAGAYIHRRRQARSVFKQIPAKMNLDIQQTAEGFKVSKSAQGRTLFTVQASKAVQFRTGGRAELHHVTITLYGRDASRYDQIYGDDFAYDPQTGDVEYRLTNVSRAEPAPDLFTVPADYTVVDSLSPRRRQQQ